MALSPEDFEFVMTKARELADEYKTLREAPGGWSSLAFGQLLGMRLMAAILAGNDSPLAQRIDEIVKELEPPAKP